MLMCTILIKSRLSLVDVFFFVLVTVLVQFHCSHKKQFDLKSFVTVLKWIVVKLLTHHSIRYVVVQPISTYSTYSIKLCRLSLYKF